MSSVVYQGLNSGVDIQNKVGCDKAQDESYINVAPNDS